ncbi:MAG: O-antigen ligase family protein [Candidatus Moranbacteria bacterium]|nr:O-antigen ligase family protein [Candidatus Moranbacteria bacterium]
MKNKILFLGLVGFCFYLPFGIALSPANDVDLSSVRVLILGFFAAWIIAGLRNRDIRLPRSLSGLLIMSFLFLNAFSLFFARNIDWSSRKLLFLFSVFPLYFIATNIITSQERRDNILKALVWGGFFAAILGIFQFSMQFVIGIDGVYGFWAKNVAPLFLGRAFSEAVLQNPSWLVDVSGKTLLRATATFPDPHMFSFFLGMLIPMALGLYMNSRKTIYAIILTALILTDMLTFSRGGYLGLVAAAIALVALFWRNISSRYKLGMIFLSVALFLVMIIPGPISSRFISSFDLNEGSNAGRLKIWKEAGEVILEHPLFGVGLGNYPLEIKPTASYREPIYAHSLYLDIATETGVLNSLIWIMLELALGYAFLLRAKEEPIYLFFFISILIFATHSLVEMPIYSPAVLSLFLIVASFDNPNLRKNEKISQS